MLVPLLVNRPLAGNPRRTVDVMPSALVALGLPVPDGLEGVSFAGEVQARSGRRVANGGRHASR